MENTPVILCDKKMSMELMHPEVVKRKESQTIAKNAETKGDVSTYNPPKGAEILKADVATNRTSSVILEGIDTSALFSHGDNRNGSITVEWDAGKNSIVQTERSSSEDSVLVSQAQTLIDLFHEVFRTSSTPLQIVLEPQETGEVVYLEQKLSDVERNEPYEEPIGSKEINGHHNVFIQNYIVEEEVKESKSEHINPMENHKELSSVQLIHRCYYCSFGSETVSIVVEHMKSHHPNKQLRTKTISGRNCPYCCIKLEQSAFFQHMRQYHGDAHPFRCGYCSFMGRDLNQIKHHCSKKHSDKSFKCFRRSNAVSSHAQLIRNEELGLQSEGVAAAENNDEGGVSKRKKYTEIEGESVEEVESSESKFHHCPVCQRKIKTLKYLKVHMRVHSRGRYKCGYCSYLSVYFLQVLQHCKKRHKLLQPRVKRHELDPSQNKSVVKNIDKFMEEISKQCSRQPPDSDARKWARKYSCPHCEYTCSYGASYRRHLTLHTSKPFPFRCKYCSFEGREKYYVRRHIQRIHRGFPPVVVENEPRGSVTRKEDKFPDPVREKKGIALDKNSSSKKQSSTEATKNASSCQEGKSSKDEERLDLGKLVEELRGSPEEEFEEEGIREEVVRWEEKERAIGDNIHSKEVTIRTEAVTEEGRNLENILEVEASIDSEMMQNGGEKTSIPQRNNEEKQENMHQKLKLKKMYSKKQVCRKGPIHKNSSENKKPILLPKGITSIHENINQKPEANILHGDNNSGGFMSGELTATIDSSEINLDGLLTRNRVVKNKESVSSNVQREIILEDADVQVYKLPDSSKIKVGKGSIVCKKKRSREKSTHKAREFVSYKEGKYTYCVCGTRTVNKAFYKHIKKHMNLKPFGCGYCYYRSIERAKVRVHHAFVHPGLPVIVSESQDDMKEDLKSRKAAELCQNPETSTKSSTVSKNSAATAPKKNSTPRTRTTVDFQCPICSKKISFHSNTIRRHIFSHYDYRPYQCGQCDFRGCSPGEVKQHSVFHGTDICPVVIPSGQQPPEGLEQLVADCFKNMRTKVWGRSIKDSPFSGYKLVTKEAVSWQETLSRGKCPWCKKKMSSPNSKAEKLLPGTDIENHFKLHFYKPIGNSSDDSGLEGTAIPLNAPSSLEEKDAIIMNGLMDYFLHNPIIEDLDMDCSKEKESRMNSGETGIISCPDGMPQGTIQIADSLLADLRYLLWGQEVKVSPKKSRKTGHKDDLNLDAACTLGLDSEEYQEQLDHQQPRTKDVLRNPQYPLWGMVDASGNSQAQDAEVGVLLLGDEIEMTTAVVVVNPEAGNSTDVEMEVSI